MVADLRPELERHDRWRNRLAGLARRTTVHGVWRVPVVLYEHPTHGALAVATWTRPDGSAHLTAARP